MHAAQNIAADDGPQRASSAVNPDEPAIDLVHLARQTEGDAELEAELLALFDRQSANLLAQLAVDGAVRAGRAEIAHQLRGSALAVGAGRVASAAETLERLLTSGRMGSHECERALGGLAAAVAEARGAIAGLLG
jgi:HPt (histidine-containing phosphotransfer) domain-containing protein